MSSSAAAPAHAVAKAPAQAPSATHEIRRDDLTQATILLGRPAIRQTDHDYFPLAVASYILGGGSVSRLYARVRDEGDAPAELRRWVRQRSAELRLFRLLQPEGVGGGGLGPLASGRCHQSISDRSPRLRMAGRRRTRASGPRMEKIASRRLRSMTCPAPPFTST